MIRATAPGKLVIMGEYAVLHGHSAVVAAVDILPAGRAVCTREGGPLAIERDAGGLVDACLAVAGDVDGRVVVDTAAFRSGDDKYGLGSSAAACVVLLRALLPHVQLDELHARAQKAHRRFQHGRGSGIDVCASVFGGFQRFVRESDDVVDVKPLPGLPRGLTLLPVWTGISADTRLFLQKVEAAQDRYPIEEIGIASARFQRAEVAHEALIAVEDGRHALMHLGEAADADIFSAVHQEIAAVARDHGGAAKPSGAGGGDISLCFVPDDGVDACSAALAQRGFRVLPLAVGARGVDVVEADA